jgi:hypothetical protein
MGDSLSDSDERLKAQGPPSRFSFTLGSPLPGAKAPGILLPVQNVDLQGRHELLF